MYWPTYNARKDTISSSAKMSQIFQLDSVAEQVEKPTSLLDTLFCSEEELGSEYRDDNFHLGFKEQCGFRKCEKINSPAAEGLLEENLHWEEEELKNLLRKEEQNELNEANETNPDFAAARREAVDWILKVNAHFSFSALTVILAINYLDRFLQLKFHLQDGNPWMGQLTAVACLSLAVKVEETQVPLPLDLQVEESRYVFEAKTIKRMEILILSTLGWKMNPVTPLSFVDHITRRLGLKDHLCREFIRRCKSILISIISGSRFLPYRPSTLALSTMLHVFISVEPFLGADYQNQLWDIMRIDKDRVDECWKLIMNAETAEGWNSNQSHKRKFRSILGSPSRVMDVSFSCDSSDSWAASSSSVSSSPELLSKKSRAPQDLSTIQHECRFSSTVITTPSSPPF